ncbi:MAG: DUF3299 domain-containing protein, partial [Rhodoferax sp.]
MNMRSLLVGLLVGTLPWVASAQLVAPPAGGLVAGSGPGVHSPNSPFAPLQERADVLQWSMLTSVKTRVEKNRVLPVFPGTIQA